MGYYIEILKRGTNDALQMKTPDYFRGSNVPAEIDPETGNLVQAKQTEASIGITYNYSPYYYKATEGDACFYGDVVDEDASEFKNLGIRGLYGKSPEEAIPLLMNMIARIKADNTDDEGNWLTGERERKHYYDANGDEIQDYILHLIRKDGVIQREEVEKYTVSEGDDSDYWEPTAANAIRSLRELLRMCIECVGMDGFIDGD